MVHEQSKAHSVENWKPNLAPVIPQNGPPIFFRRPLLCGSIMGLKMRLVIVRSSTLSMHVEVCLLQYVSLQMLLEI